MASKTIEMMTAALAGLNAAKTVYEEQAVAQDGQIAGQFSDQSAAHGADYSAALEAMATEHTTRLGEIDAAKQEKEAAVAALVGTNASPQNLETIWGIGKEVQASDNNFDTLLSNKEDELSAAITAFEIETGTVEGDDNSTTPFDIS
jgi:hypothetical protein